jgi:hypothetical protein
MSKVRRGLSELVRRLVFSAVGQLAFLAFPMGLYIKHWQSPTALKILPI